MKKLALILIVFYQNFFSVVLKNVLGVSKFCKFSPTCSEYTKQMIEKHGAIAGVLFGIKRIGSCI